MPESKVTRSMVVTNPEGLHARAVVAIAEAVRRGRSRVTLTKEGQRVEATDVLQLLTLAAAEGERVEVEAIGPDAEAVVASLEPLFAAPLDDNAPKAG
jgi:phosphocarrier protein HPr